MRSKLTVMIIAAAIAGVLAGYAANELAPDAATAATIAGYFSVMADIFLRLIKMIIAPLVFATVVVGIAGTGDAKTVGRIGLKALAWFITASLVSRFLGMIFANLFQPGANLNLPLPGRRSVDMPMSVELRRSFELLGLPPDRRARHRGRCCRGFGGARGHRARCQVPVAWRPGHGRPERSRLDRLAPSPRKAGKWVGVRGDAMSVASGSKPEPSKPQVSGETLRTSPRNSRTPAVACPSARHRPDRATSSGTSR
jgi:hypothetical protein